MHRVARIFPAFLVCLVVTAFVFAPIAYLHQHGTVDGLLTTPTTPLNYVFGNATLRMFAFDVAGTPGNVPYPGAWNGSLWTLYYEFGCYMVVAALGSAFAEVVRLSGLLYGHGGIRATKAVLTRLGLPAGPVRPPQIDVAPEVVDEVLAHLHQAGVPAIEGWDA